jgi:serine/threonine-protein kinase
VFELQDKMGRRSAEAVRVELSTIAHRGQAPAEAIELYLRARRNLRQFRRNEEEPPVVLLDRCLSLAPGFKPAIAAYALACLFEWFAPNTNREDDWENKAREAVERALTEAPELVESHYAAGKHAVQHGDYRKAARSLSRALTIAPTYAEVHEYLGRLQCEAGRSRQGIDHIRLALDLDPMLVGGLYDIARMQALHGEWDAYAETIEEFTERLEKGSVIAMMLRLRVAGWRRDEREIKRCIAKTRDIPAGPTSRPVVLISAGLSGRRIDDEMVDELLDEREGRLNPRYATVTLQVIAEVCAFQGDLDRAMYMITKAADLVLVDIDWIDRCPLFEELRARPEFAPARAKVKARAEAIWSI